MDRGFVQKVEDSLAALGRAAAHARITQTFRPAVYKNTVKIDGGSKGFKPNILRRG